MPPRLHYRYVPGLGGFRYAHRDFLIVDRNRRGEYATKHDPFVYFDDVTNKLNPNSAYCIAHVPPFMELAGDLQNGNVAQYNFITPNLCDDMHDPARRNTIRSCKAISGCRRNRHKSSCHKAGRCCRLQPEGRVQNGSRLELKCSAYQL
jgi:hypothetical protein